MSNIVMWSLFDSGNGSYAKEAGNFPQIENFSVGIDRENKNDHFINLDLADYSYLFGKDKLFEVLDRLPKPDIILASPPCESWSVASAMKDGNACWKQEKGDALFEPQKPLSRFTIREFEEFKDHPYNPMKAIGTRINGELCAFNVIRIIRRYKPTVHVIENPAYGRIWEYIEKILGFNLKYENLTFYNNYNNYPIKKPTKFGSNIDFNLKTKHIPNEVRWEDTGWGYNERSNIPPDLVNELIEKSVYVVDMKKRKTHPMICEVM